MEPSYILLPILGYVFPCRRLSVFFGFSPVICFFWVWSYGLKSKHKHSLELSVTDLMKQNVKEALRDILYTRIVLFVHLASISPSLQEGRHIFQRERITFVAGI